MKTNKVDMTLERSSKQWSDLLHAVKVNDNNVLNKEQQNYYVEQIEIKLGIRNRKAEVLKMIEESKADEIKID